MPALGKCCATLAWVNVASPRAGDFCLNGSLEQPRQITFATGVSVSAPKPRAHASRVVMTVENVLRWLYRTLRLFNVVTTGVPSARVIFGLMHLNLGVVPPKEL